MAANEQGTGLLSKIPVLLVSGKWSDLTIKCRYREWKVHRVVCCLQSRPLSAAIDGEFLEAQTGIIDLGDQDPDIVNHMITFMYTGGYEPKSNNGSQNSPGTGPTLVAVIDLVEADNRAAAEELLIHTAVYLLADENDISALKSLAAKKYKKALSRGWNSATFCSTLEKIYEGTPGDDDTLLSIAISFAASKIKELMGRAEFVELLRSNGDISVAIIKHKYHH